jgi:hypothetical protein
VLPFGFPFCDRFVWERIFAGQRHIVFADLDPDSKYCNSSVGNHTFLDKMQLGEAILRSFRLSPIHFLSHYLMSDFSRDQGNSYGSIPCRQRS